MVWGGTQPSAAEASRAKDAEALAEWCVAVASLAMGGTSMQYEGTWATQIEWQRLQEY